MSKTPISKPGSATNFFTSKLLNGLIVGAIATQALDWISIYLYNRENEADFDRETEARGGLHAYEKGLDQLTRAFGVPLQEKDLKVWGWRFHKAFGLFGGVGYSLLRNRYPRIKAGNGLLFGSLFFLGADELMMPALGWTPGPRAFPWRTHARGAISHLAYGVTAESVARSLETVRRTRQDDQAAA